MAEEKDLPCLHIVLDASKTKRCDWCGSPQSDSWLSHKEGTFCSNSCIKAASSENRWTTALMTGFYATIFIWAWIWLLVECAWVPFNFILVLLGFTIFCVVPLSVMTINEFANHRFAREIPKGSRRHLGVSQISMLRRISGPLQCPNCDGNVNMDEIDEDMVYTCRYCGASGLIKIDYLE